MTMILMRILRYFSVAMLLLAVATSNAQEEAISPLDQIVPVAEEGIDDGNDGSEMSVPEISDEDLLAQEFERYKDFMKNGVLDEADTVAKRIIEIAIRLKGPQSNDTARALTNLAIVQHRSKQFEAAQQNFMAAVEIIENNEDRLNGQLVNPLKGLGAAQLESGRPDLADGSFRRAVHITHVNNGPHILDQLELLESLAEVNLRLGAVDVAKQVNDTMYALNLRRFSEDSIELVPSLTQRAAWQHRAGLINDERATYRRIVRIIETTAGKDDLRLIGPLTGLGQSFFYIDTSGTQGMQQPTMSMGELYFRRALRIAENNAESDWQLIARTTLSLGDYYMYGGNRNRARKTYAAAWELLSADESRLAFRQNTLERATALSENPLPKYVGGSGNSTGFVPDDKMLQATITVSYAVSPRGRVSNLKIIEAEPPEFTDMQRFVQRELRARVFRPRFEDAEPVTSLDQLLIHTYYYRQSDLDAIRNAVGDAEVNDAG